MENTLPRDKWNGFAKNQNIKHWHCTNKAFCAESYQWQNLELRDEASVTLLTSALCPTGICYIYGMV